MFETNERPNGGLPRERFRPLAGNAEFGMPPLHFVTGRDAPHTRLPAGDALLDDPFRVYCTDETPRRRYRPHFRVRDPIRTLTSAQSGRTKLLEEQGRSNPSAFAFARCEASRRSLPIDLTSRLPVRVGVTRDTHSSGACRYCTDRWRRRFAPAQSSRRRLLPRRRASWCRRLPATRPR